MAPTEDHLLSAPPGWQVGEFLANVLAELRAHSTAASTAIILLILLAIGTVLLPEQARPRLRTALVLFVVYVASMIGRPELLTLGHDGAAYQWLAVAGLLALAFGIISVSALILFDVLARRFGVPRIMRDITTAIATAVVLVALLARSGVNLLQLVTTSAILTAIIGLALQDTLGNIIGGVALQLDSAVAIGDWVRVDDKVTGRVREIRWRSTLLETKNGDLIAYPNSLMNRATVQRFNHDGLEHRQWVYFHVALRHPPNRVTTVVLDALKDTPNVSKQTPPDCLVWEFDGTGIKYAVRYRLIDFRPDDPTDSEVKKRIWYALQRAELEMPFPTTNMMVTDIPADQEERQHSRDLRHRLRALSRISMFEPLNEDERRTLAEGLHFQPFAAGELILRQGEAGDSLFIVRSGRVSVRLSLEGSAKEIAQLAAGDFFGEMSLLTGEPRRATITAIEDTECYVVDRALIDGILQRNPSLAEGIGKLLAERQRELEVERKDLLVSHRAPNEADLLDRIRRFFGLR